MKTKVLWIFVMILMITGTSSIFAQKSVKPVTLTFWAGSAYYNSEEAKRPQSEWAITKIIKQFEAQNPGVTVDMTPIDLNSETIAKFKAAAIAKNGPDVIELWTGTYLFPLKGILLPLNKYIPAADKKNISGWDAVTYNFKPNGEILGYPIGNNYAGLVYNKVLIKAAGMDWDKNPPKTTEGIPGRSEKNKGDGRSPLRFRWFEGPYSALRHNLLVGGGVRL